jgi:hypothetical protein
MYCHCDTTIQPHEAAKIGVGHAPDWDEHCCPICADSSTCHSQRQWLQVRCFSCVISVRIRLWNCGAYVGVNSPACLCVSFYFAMHACHNSLLSNLCVHVFHDVRRLHVCVGVGSSIIPAFVLVCTCAVAAKTLHPPFLRTCPSGPTAVARATPLQLAVRIQTTTCLASLWTVQMRRTALNARHSGGVVCRPTTPTPGRR